MTDDALTELASVQPAARGVDASFHLLASDTADLTLTGEVDSISADVFGRVLSRLLVGADADRIVIDSAGLRFIDHHGLLAIETAAGAATIELRDGPPIAGRVVELLELDRVVVRP